MEKGNSIRKILLFAAFIFLAAGCKEKKEKVSDLSGTVSETEETDADEAEHIAEICRDIYEEKETNTIGSLEAMRRIVARFGECGYTAVDSENQVNMTKPEQVMDFCKAAKKQEPAELTILVVTDSGLRKFDLKTEAGKINVVREYYQYNKQGDLQRIDTASYPADYWQFTKEGYLIFEGKYFSDINYVLTLSDTPEYTVLRVLPLDERCREWNRKYIMPAGYGRNNIFLFDWSEEDFGALDLYDVFDVFYPDFYQKPVPYTADENLNVGTVYQIPEDEFEGVILAHFNVDQETVRAKTSYLPEKAAYEYRPRGFYEVDYSDIPYPEVVDYRENQDGTITLLVNAVYPDGKTSKLFSHQTVIRPLRNEGELEEADNAEVSLSEEEGFCYVSNQVIFSSMAKGRGEGQESLSAENDNSFWWHSDRLTEEQWEEKYAGKEQRR